MKLVNRLQQQIEPPVKICASGTLASGELNKDCRCLHQSRQPDTFSCRMTLAFKWLGRGRAKRDLDICGVKNDFARDGSRKRGYALEMKREHGQV